MLLNYQIPAHLLDKLEGKSTTEIEGLITKALEEYFDHKVSSERNNFQNDIMLSLLISIADKVDGIAADGVTKLVQQAVSQPVIQQPSQPVIEQKYVPVMDDLDEVSEENLSSLEDAFLFDICK